MPWPPQAGKLLQRYDEPLKIAVKLREYSLNQDDPRSWPKANGFRSMLGIELSSLSYLEGEIRRGIAHTPIFAVRANPVRGFSCMVQFRISGPGRYSHRDASAYLRNRG